MNVFDFRPFFILAVGFSFLCWSVTEWRLKDARRHISQQGLVFFALLQALALLGQLDAEPGRIEIYSLAASASWFGFFGYTKKVSLNERSIFFALWIIADVLARSFTGVELLGLLAPCFAVPAVLDAFHIQPSKNKIGGMLFALALPSYLLVSMLLGINDGQLHAVWARFFPQLLGEVSWLSLAQLSAAAAVAVSGCMRLYPAGQRRKRRVVLNSLFLLLLFIIALVSAEISKSLGNRTIQTVGALLDQNLSRLKRSISFIVEESDNAARQLERVLGVAMQENESQNGKRFIDSGIAEKAVDILSSLSGNTAAFVLDPKGNVIWGSASNMLIPDAASLKAVGTKYLSRFAREGSPLSEFRESPSGTGAGYFVASLLRRSDEEVGILLLVRPLNQRSLEPEGNENIDLLVGAHNRHVYLQDQGGLDLQLNAQFRPQGLTLPAQHTLLTDNYGSMFLFSQEALSVPKWKVASATPLPQGFSGGQTGFLISFLFSIITWITYSLTLSRPRALELDTSLRLQSRSPLKRSQFLARIIAQYMQTIAQTMPGRNLSEMESEVREISEALSNFASSTGSRDQDTKEFSVTQLVSVCKKLVAERLQNRGVSLEILPGAAEDITLVGDAQRIQTILNAVLLRAIAVTPDGASVLLHSDLSTLANKSYLHVTITHPLEINSATSPQSLYDPQSVADLGGIDSLRYVFAIESILAMHGQIDVQSASEVGARISLQLPIGSE